MQVVKWTGWTLEYIESFALDEIHKMIVWAYNQEAQERNNVLIPLQWHLLAQNKKTQSNAKKLINKATKQQNYNIEEQELSDTWLKFMRGINPQVFDQYLGKYVNIEEDTVSSAGD